MWETRTTRIFLALWKATVTPRIWMFVSQSGGGQLCNRNQFGMMQKWKWRRDTRTQLTSPIFNIGEMLGEPKQKGLAKEPYTTVEKPWRPQPFDPPDTCTQSQIYSVYWNVAITLACNYALVRIIKCIFLHKPGYKCYWCNNRWNSPRYQQCRKSFGIVSWRMSKRMEGSYITQPAWAATKK